MAEYKPQCSVCHVYPSTRLSGDRNLCLRCFEQVALAIEEKELQIQRSFKEQEQSQRKLEAEAREPKSKVSFCQSCLTTLGILHQVCAEPKRFLCSKCKAKAQPKGWSLAASYTVSHTPRESDPNRSY
jgi:hypothetical protein